jgi:hypothetical protein
MTSFLFLLLFSCTLNTTGWVVTVAEEILATAGPESGQYVTSSASAGLFGKLSRTLPFVPKKGSSVGLAEETRACAEQLLT